MARTNVILLYLFIVSFASIRAQLLEGIYCGQENCYDVLNVTRDATKSEISKSYRKLARQYHPDMHRSTDAKIEAEAVFKKIANAYELLKDEESRTDYDYMLDNPDEYYAHYYRYYRRRVAPKVDVRIVIVLTISVISLVQYFSGWQRYDTAISYFATIPKYRNRALDIAKQDGLLSDNRKVKGRHKTSKEETEQIIRKIIEEKMDIKGAYAKPSITDILWIQLVLFPYTLCKYIYWYISWFCRHTIMKQPYSDEEKLYIIRKNMKLSTLVFNGLEDDVKQDYLNRELWMKENFEIWYQEEEENNKKQLAENNKYKQYRRYMKNHGVGRMTFDDS